MTAFEQNRKLRDDYLKLFRTFMFLLEEADYPLFVHAMEPYMPKGALSPLYHSDRASLRKNFPVSPPPPLFSVGICVSMNGVRAPSSGVSVPL